MKTKTKKIIFWFLISMVILFFAWFTARQIIWMNTLERIMNVDYNATTTKIENIKDLDNKDEVDIKNRYFVGDVEGQKFHLIHTTLNSARNSDQVYCSYVLDGVSDIINECNAEFALDGWFVINLTGYQNRLVGYACTFNKGEICTESERSEKSFNLQEVESFEITDYLKK